MTKDQLSKALADKTKLAQADIKRVLDAQAEIISAELIASGESSVFGVGLLKVKAVQAHKGRNPNTGEAIDVPAKNKIVFKVLKKLRDGVNK